MKNLSPKPPGPQPLLTALNVESQIHLVIGSNPLAAARCTKCLDSGSTPIIIAPPSEDINSSFLQKLQNGNVRWVQRQFKDDDLSTLGREEVDHYVDAVFVTLGPNNPLSIHISKLCRRLRIPVNVVDAPELCSFTLLSTYSDGPLRIGITTSGRGCKLASRLRREIASCLPSGLGNAIEILGNVRKRIWEEDVYTESSAGFHFEADDDDSAAQKHTFNSLMLPEDPESAKTRRMRWLSQICEYWPLRRLASITDADVEKILAAYKQAKAEHINDVKLELGGKNGQVILAGSGPGHPDLVTRATYRAIMSADLILSDKLVPAPVLDLIPRRTEVRIARKFPGNADKAQNELLEMALEGLRAGKRVLRLKQGDPYLYGRGAEEYEFFRSKGYTPIVLPGITSALSAPLFAGISATHRGVADQVLICTGTGRHGAAPEPPSYIPSQTVVFLMALHRLPSLLESLTTLGPEDKGSRHPWPRDTPCAVIERASCADQRVIRSTLEHVCAAIEAEGSRPPGLLVVGKSCEVLHRTDQPWVVEEGFKGLDDIGLSDGLEVIDELGRES
ncbi:potential uroporphyrin-3 C-methyltransferase [Uncinocarpus reesii 1704]|uniref:Potential uroporphyrin-3 C-methyltransferase n=1 Tax=Uncinocarpus reesii (strain UAMH 1704) TaxID=336963 RepID=C4JE83_UNCRE|nr:putative uroporphyrin-3 C-methyltransferase [Uncinocarpus reesii 1704]EEP75661.1 potential uroporphyrin-3 C-methyltransferase [Uncinocarpus reesii 1704]